VTVTPIWRSCRGSGVKSQRYSAWLNEAGYALNVQKPGRIDGEYSISVSLCKPDNRKRDLDNVSTKVIYDLLVTHGVVTDDSLCVQTSSRWVESGPECVVELVSAADRKRAGFCE